MRGERAGTHSAPTAPVLGGSRATRATLDEPPGSTTANFFEEFWRSNRGPSYALVGSCRSPAHRRRYIPAIFLERFDPVGLEHCSCDGPITAAALRRDLLPLVDSGKTGREPGTRSVTSLNRLRCLLTGYPSQTRRRQSPRVLRSGLSPPPTRPQERSMPQMTSHLASRRTVHQSKWFGIPVGAQGKLGRQLPSRLRERLGRTGLLSTRQARGRYSGLREMSGDGRRNATGILPRFDRSIPGNRSECAATECRHSPNSAPIAMRY